MQNAALFLTPRGAEEFKSRMLQYSGCTAVAIAPMAQVGDIGWVCVLKVRLRDAFVWTPVTDSFIEFEAQKGLT